MPFLFVDLPTYRRVQEFAAIDRSDVEATVRYALNDWMNSTGDCLLDFLTSEETKAARKAAKVAAKSDARATASDGGLISMGLARPNARMPYSAAVGVDCGSMETAHCRAVSSIAEGLGLKQKPRNGTGALSQ